MWRSDSNGCPSCYCEALGSAAASSGDNTASGSSASEGGVPGFVPVVIALVCLCVAMVGVIAVYRYRRRNRFLEQRPSAQELVWDDEAAVPAEDA